MNKYNVKKSLMTLGIVSTLSLPNCSQKDSNIDKNSNRNMEKEIDKVKIGYSTIEGALVSKFPKHNLIQKINKSDCSRVVKDILKEIVKFSKNEQLVLNNIDMAMNKDGKRRNHFLYAAIIEATRDQKWEKDYQLNNLKIFDNLNNKISRLPKQIGIFEHCATYGSYLFYEIVESEFSANSFLCLVTDKEDNILLVSKEEKIEKVQDAKLSELANLLKVYGIKPQEKYTHQELLEETTFELNRKIHGNRNSDFNQIEIKDMIVVDTSNMSISKQYNQRYCFLKYRYPYLFASSTDVYSDIFNPDANITIDKYNTVNYTDRKEQINLFDLIPSNRRPCFCSFREFLTNNNLPVTKSITLEQIQEINNNFNKQEENIGNQKVSSIQNNLLK